MENADKQKLPLLTRLKQAFGPKDLTQGTIWKTIVAFSLPIFVSYILQELYVLVDSAICGHTLAPTEVAGVNNTAAIWFIFMQFAYGCTAGMSVMISRKIGERNEDGVRKEFATQIVLGLIICAVVTTVSLLSIKPLLRLLGIAPDNGGTNNEVFRAAFTYISIICGGMIGQFFYNSICCTLRAMGDSFTPLVFLLISTLLNIALDLLFIMAFHWGVAGAAIATVVSQTLSAIACFIYTFVHYKQMRLKLSDFRAIRFKPMMRTLWQGVPLGLQFSVLAFGILTMSNVVIAFDKNAAGVMVDGTPAQLGYSAACKLDDVFMTPLNAIGTGMISFCGQNLGAGKDERIRKGVKQAVLITIVLSVIESGIILLLSINGAYQHLYLSADKITDKTVEFGNTYLYSVVPVFFTLGLIFVLRSCLQGIGKPIYPILVGAAELSGRILICLLLPKAVNGAPIDSNASRLAFFCVGLGDVGAWIAADIILIGASIKYFFIKPKSSATDEKMSPTDDAAPTQLSAETAESEIMSTELESEKTEAIEPQAPPPELDAP